MKRWQKDIENIVDKLGWYKSKLKELSDKLYDYEN